jgi:hypothetical protein
MALSNCFSMSFFKNSFPVLASFLAFSSGFAASPLQPQKKGEMSIKKPAFLSLERLQENAPLSLVVSSFNPFGSDGISTYSDIASHLTLLNEAKPSWSAPIRWPNEARLVDSHFVGKPMMIVAGGFLVPGKATGAITLIDPVTQESSALTQDKSGYFYHRTHLMDFNGDGRLDVLTARVNKPIIGASKGELLWLEQPAENALSQRWKEHVLVSGPDVHFQVRDIDDNGTPEIIATQFFSKKLTLLWSEEGKYQVRVIDDTLGSAFDVVLADINSDGQDDLLVTNHEKDEKAAVFAYEIPADFRAGVFKRHTLIAGIETQSGFQAASPGQAVAFHPTKALASEKPYILVSGDGSHKAHILSAKSQEKTDWSYEESVLVNAQGTVGQSAVGDVDGDGAAEIFVPSYDRDVIHVFSYGE